MAVLETEITIIIYKNKTLFFIIIKSVKDQLNNMSKHFVLIFLYNYLVL
jgi:hypothetical protein